MSGNPPGTVLADRIAYLWSEERCDWSLNHEAAFYGNPSTWRVDLEWTQEYRNPHGADWAMFTWQFYGDDAEEAMVTALDWLEALAPWKRCAACGGEGDEHQLRCDECHGSGLAHAPHPGDSEAGES